MEINKTSDAAALAARAARRKKRRRIRKIKKIWNGITSALLAAALVLAILIWGLRLLGMEAYIVQSGSMEPALKVGAMVYVGKADPAGLEPGDIITFSLAGDTLVTHRIESAFTENNTRFFRTKGDANELSDSSPVPAENVVGKVRFSVPGLGYLVSYIQQPPGTYAAFAAVASLLLLTVLPEILFDDTPQKKKKPPAGKKAAEQRKPPEGPPSGTVNDTANKEDGK